MFPLYFAPFESNLSPFAYSQAANDEDWILEPSQTGGDVKTYLRHITAGAELAVRDPQALLIYSGGQTRLDPRTSLTEASSYARLARAGNIYSQFAQQTESGVTEFDRVTTEVRLSVATIRSVGVADFVSWNGHRNLPSIRSRTFSSPSPDSKNSLEVILLSLPSSDTV